MRFSIEDLEYTTICIFYSYSGVLFYHSIKYCRIGEVEDILIKWPQQWWRTIARRGVDWGVCMNLNIIVWIHHSMVLSFLLPFLILLLFFTFHFIFIFFHIFFIFFIFFMQEYWLVILPVFPSFSFLLNGITYSSVNSLTLWLNFIAILSKLCMGIFLWMLMAIW